MTDSPSETSAERVARSLSRRDFLAAQLVAAGSLAGLGTGVTGAAAQNAVENTVSLDTAARSDATVEDTLFGRLNEHYGDGTIYPGVYSLHVMNPTFWRVPDYWFGDAIDTFYEVERDDVLPYPWERMGDGAEFELRSDGDRVAGGDSPHGTVGYPRVSLDGAGGLRQRIVLPDTRTLGYDLAVSVRGDVDALTASITTLDGDTLASAEVPVSESWERHEPTLELDGRSGDEYVGGAVANLQTPYGQYAIEFRAEGTGHFDIDFVELAADDAVNGKFNPLTVELLADQNGTWLKWPGGNVTSQYNWRDGVGALESRTPRFNHAWQGIQPNFFGTAEYLELCEVADLTPEITVGWWDNPPEWATERRILPENAANWVEYVNSSQETEMGQLRAEHGHPEPWDVEHWGVGNEVWGDWQHGHTSDPATYAVGEDSEVPGGNADRIGFDAYSEAMRAVDDSITVLASGWDPAEAAHNDNPWNETLLEELSPDLLDGLNIHRYQWGLETANDVTAWKSEHDADDWDYNEVLVMAATQLGDQLVELGEMAAEKGYDDFYINLSELGIFPTVAPGAPYPGPETMPGASYVAGALNAAVRNPDTIEWLAQTWVPLKTWVPVKTTDYPPDPNPMRPDNSVTGLYAAVFDGDDEWRAVDATTDGAGRDLPDTGPRVNEASDVPYVDAAAVRNEREELVAFLTNRNLRAASEVTVELGADYAGAVAETVALQPSTDERPLPHDLPSSWKEPTNHTVSATVSEVGGDGTVTLTMPPASVVRLFAGGDGDAETPSTGVWHGLADPVNVPDGSGTAENGGSETTTGQEGGDATTDGSDATTAANSSTTASEGTPGFGLGTGLAALGAGALAKHLRGSDE